MEWVETTGRTIDDAKEAALDELGVDEHDAEFELLEEPKLGLFGRLRTEGRVRARVRPVAPPAKDDRRRRGRKDAKPDGAAKDAGSTPVAVEDDAPVAAAPRTRTRAAKSGGAGAGGRNVGGRTETDGGADDVSRVIPTEETAADPSRGPKRNPDRANTADERPARSGRSSNGAAKASGHRSSGHNDHAPTRGEGNEVEVSLEEQSQVAQEFLRGLVGEFGVTADIASTQPDEDTLDLALTGTDLGMLIGPKGSTLLALQDLTRTVVQRKTGANNGRIHVDVSGYRQKRSEALSRFAQQVAEQVKSSGERKALEPMAAPDRKVVHDALTDVDGVTTASEGEDAARRVVILPAGD